MNINAYKKNLCKIYFSVLNILSKGHSDINKGSELCWKIDKIHSFFFPNLNLASINACIKFDYSTWMFSRHWMEMKFRCKSRVIARLIVNKICSLTTHKPLPPDKDISAKLQENLLVREWKLSTDEQMDWWMHRGYNMIPCYCEPEYKTFVSQNVSSKIHY